MKIRIIKGATRIDNVIRTSVDGVFSVDGSVGAHLIARGVAEAVAEPADSYDAPAPHDTPAGEIGQSPGEGGDSTAGDAYNVSGDVVTIPAYSADMKQQELRDIGAAFGIDFPAICSKASMVEALDEYFASDDTEGGILDLTPQMPE